MPMLLHQTPCLPINAYTGRLVSGAVLILPAAILVAPHPGEAAYLLLAVLGVYYFLHNSLHHRAHQPILLLSLLTLGFYLVALVSALVSDNPSAGLSKLGNLREFLAAPFIGLLLFNTGVSTRFIMLTVKISALLVFLVAYYQLLNGISRPGGGVNPLVFAVPSLLLGFFSLVRFPLESTPEKLLSLAAFSSGCMAAVISQSRATWILSIFLLICVLYFWHRTGHLKTRIALGISTLFLTLVLVSLQTTAVQQRIDSALNEYRTFSMHGEWESSVGNRIILWKSGISAAMKKPVAGWGADQTQVAAASELQTLQMKRVVLGYNHLHNEYLTNLVAKGLPGLLSLLLLLFVPLAIFLKNSRNPEILVCNGIGALLCIGYALSGLTNQAFGDDTLNMFFIFFLAITLPGSLHDDRIYHSGP
jgi:O-antigen ligase